MGVALGLFRLTLRDRNAGTRRQRRRQEPPGACRDGIVNPASGGSEVTARQGNLGDVCAI